MGGIQVLLIPFAILKALLLAPVFEEALFRGWLYNKTRPIQQRWAVGLLNGWYFMLTHLLVLAPAVVLGFTLNAAQVSPVSAPVWFAMGLLLFWVREKYQSITLCIFLHALYNGIMLAGFHWVQTTLSQ